jgi:hypothetical protein
MEENNITKDDQFVTIPSTAGRYMISPLGVIIDLGYTPEIDGTFGNKRLPVIVSHRKDTRSDPHVYLRVTMVNGKILKGSLFGATDVAFESRKFNVKDLLAMAFMPQTPVGRAYGTKVKLRDPAFPITLDNIYIHQYSDKELIGDSFSHIASVSRIRQDITESTESITTDPNSITPTTGEPRLPSAGSEIDAIIPQTVEDILCDKRKSQLIMHVPGSNGRYFIDKYGNMYDRKLGKRIQFDQCPRTSKLRMWISFPGSGNSFWAYYSNIVALTVKLNGEWIKASTVPKMGKWLRAEPNEESPANSWGDRQLPRHLLKDAYFSRHKNGDIWDFSYRNIEIAVPESMIDYTEGSRVMSKDILFKTPNMPNFSRDYQHTELSLEFTIFNPPKRISFSASSGLIADKKKVLMSYVQTQAAVVAYHDFGTDIEHIAKGLFQCETKQELIYNKEMLTWLLKYCMPNQRYSAKSRWSRSLRYCLEKIALQCPA